MWILHVHQTNYVRIQQTFTSIFYKFYRNSRNSNTNHQTLRSPSFPKRLHTIVSNVYYQQYMAMVLHRVCFKRNSLSCAWIRTLLLLHDRKKDFDGNLVIKSARWCYTGQLATPTFSQRMFFARICRHVTLLNRFQKLPTRCSTANIATNCPQRGVMLEPFFAQHRIVASWRCKLTSVTSLRKSVFVPTQSPPQARAHETEG